MLAALIGGAAVAMQAFGVYQSYSAGKQQQEYQQQANAQAQQQYQAQMAQYQYELQVREQNLAKKAAAFGKYEQGQDLQLKQQDVELQAAKLDASRRKREIIREAVVARASGVQNAVNQGASLTDSSVVGGTQQTAARAASNLFGVEANLGLTETLFGLKREESIAYREANRILNSIQQPVPLPPQPGFPNYTGQSSALGTGLYAIGGGLAQNADQYSRVFNQVGSYFGFGGNPVNVGSAISTG